MSERRTKLLVGLAVWLSFLAVSLVSAPIPGVNEPYYLAMAKHTWDPNWCRGDFFLQSFPAHQIFYAVFGPLTRWFELPTVAFAGRVFAIGLLAASWTMLVGRLAAETMFKTDNRNRRVIGLRVLVAAWLFLGMQGIGNLSGEWLVGGFESKVIAYSCAFASIAAIWDRRFVLAALFCGLTVSLHPVIGIWHLIAVGIAETWWLWREGAFELRFPKFQIITTIAVFVAAAFPGLWPALRMLSGVDPRINFQANYIQVLYRLKHHLDPLDFSVLSYLAYGGLFVVWMVLLGKSRSADESANRLRERIADRWWMAYVVGAGLIALGGLLIGLGSRAELAPQGWTLGRVLRAYTGEPMPGLNWRIGLLKFYPFRLFDLLLPLAVSIGLARAGRRPHVQAIIVSIAVVGFVWAVVAGRVFPPPHPWNAATRADWSDACRWIERATPEDALFLTPVESDTFKWLAHRAEFVNFKDCPQDATGVVEWNRRLKLLARWGKESYADDQRFSAGELSDLRARTGIDFVVTRRPVAYDAKLMFQNRMFKIFQLPEPPEN